MGIVLVAIRDTLTSEWLCSECFDPLAYDGLWQDDGGTLELYVCHNCALEYSRSIGNSEFAPTAVPDGE